MENLIGQFIHRFMLTIFNVVANQSFIPFECNCSTNQCKCMQYLKWAKFYCAVTIANHMKISTFSSIFLNTFFSFNTFFFFFFFIFIHAHSYPHIHRRERFFSLSWLWFLILVRLGLTVKHLRQIRFVHNDSVVRKYKYFLLQILFASFLIEFFSDYLLTSHKNIALNRLLMISTINYYQ